MAGDALAALPPAWFALAARRPTSCLGGGSCCLCWGFRWVRGLALRALLPFCFAASWRLAPKPTTAGPPEALDAGSQRGKRERTAMTTSECGGSAVGVKPGVFSKLPLFLLLPGPLLRSGRKKGFWPPPPRLRSRL